MGAVHRLQDVSSPLMTQNSVMVKVQVGGPPLAGARRRTVPIINRQLLSRGWFDNDKRSSVPATRSQKKALISTGRATSCHSGPGRLATRTCDPGRGPQATTFRNITRRRWIMIVESEVPRASSLAGWFRPLRLPPPGLGPPGYPCGRDPPTQP